MGEETIEFKILEAKLVGSDTVVFRLEDGALVKIKVDLERAGIATNFKNPDGSPHYNLTPRLSVNVIPSDKTFHVLKSQVAQPTQPKEPKMKPI